MQNNGRIAQSYIIASWSIVVCLIFSSLGEVIVCIFGQWTIFESVRVWVIRWKRVNFHLADFASDKVLEGSCLFATLAFDEVFDVWEAHTRV